MNQIEGQNQWHVLQAMHGKAEKAQAVFTKKGITSFVPMKSVSETIGRKTTTKLVPILNHLIFADTETSVIREIRETNNYIYYRPDLTDNKKPMIVPREEMEYFIDFVQSGGDEGYDELEYIDIDSFNIKAGERVRITSGIFKGKEGLFVKVEGKHLKQIVVAVAGIISLKIKHPNPSRIIELI